MANRYCVNCDTFIPRFNKICYSGIYGSSEEHILCSKCSIEEEKLILDTNDQPDKLQLYQKNLEKRCSN